MQAWNRAGSVGLARWPFMNTARLSCHLNSVVARGFNVETSSLVNARTETPLLKRTSWIRTHTTSTSSSLTKSLLPPNKYNQLTREHVAALKAFVPENCCLDADTVGAAELDAYNEDWMGKYKGNSRLVLKPKTTEQVSMIMKYCYENNLPVVPQGGNTGLVGGSVPIDSEIILSLSNMNNIISFNETSGILVCEAGCILETLDNYVASRNHIMPLDLGAKGTCHIGGNVATNAGGLRLLRYGSMHGSVLGLEVVLANGKVLSNINGLRKDNTGYFLHHLFIGSEGSLGVITKVAILTPPRPTAVNVAILAVPSYASITKAFKAAKKHLGEILSAFEFWDTASHTLALQQLSYLRAPLETSTPFYVLIETSGSDSTHDAEKMTNFLESVMEDGTAVDGTLAQDETQAKSFWAIREGIPEACSKNGKVYKYDVSVPVDKLYELVEKMRTRLTEKGIYKGELPSSAPVRSAIGYGHIGDGNLHLNIACTEYNSTIANAIEPYVYELVSEVNGSVSAEHGVGQMKVDKLKYTKGVAWREWMKKMKQVWDDKGILNPGKVVEL